MTHRSFEDSRYNGKPRCRICGTENDITKHHIVPRSLIGKHPGKEKSRVITAEGVGHRCNIVKLCRWHHEEIEHGGFRSTLRTFLRPHELRHIERVAGRAWMDREYPRELSEFQHPVYPWG